MNRFILALSRFLLFILLVFEYLNHIKIFHFNIEFTWIGLIITGSAIWITLELIFFWMKKKCSDVDYGHLLFIAMLGVYLDALGDVFFMYSRYSWYDQVAHFTSGAAAGIIVFWIIKILVDCHEIKLGSLGLIFFSWMTAGFLGMTYELEEYLEDFFTGSHRLGDGFDTANDLMLDILGALVIILIAAGYLYYKKKRISRIPTEEKRDLSNN